MVKDTKKPEKAKRAQDTSTILLKFMKELLKMKEVNDSIRLPIQRINQLNLGQVDDSRMSFAEMFEFTCAFLFLFLVIITTQLL